MAVAPNIIEESLRAYFGDNASWILKDLIGDNDHYDLVITSELFVGKSLVAQHQMVNEALKELLVNDLHALKITTKKS